MTRMIGILIPPVSLNSSVDQDARNFVIGIIAMALSGGLTLVFSSDYILELINDFDTELSRA